MKRCCICDKDILIGHAYLCWNCYQIYKPDMKSRWLNYLCSTEQNERNRFRREPALESIDDLIDREFDLSNKIPTKTSRKPPKFVKLSNNTFIYKSLELKLLSNNVENLNRI